MPQVTFYLLKRLSAKKYQMTNFVRNWRVRNWHEREMLNKRNKITTLETSFSLSWSKILLLDSNQLIWDGWEGQNTTVWGWEGGQICLQDEREGLRDLVCKESTEKEEMHRRHERIKMRRDEYKRQRTKKRQLRKKITEFYYQPDVSYTCPGKKDYVMVRKKDGSKEKAVKHILVFTLRCSRSRAPLRAGSTDSSVMICTFFEPI